MSVELRPLRWWDIAPVHELELQLFPHDPWTITQFWGELARVPESRHYLVAECSGELAGYAGMFAIGDVAEVQTIAVAPAQQGHGVGRVLLSAIVAESERRGAETLRLEVRADNQAALRLYEQAGFAVDGQRRDYYGPGQPGTLMSLSLTKQGGG
ncbi:MAG: ribosomal protein S18-alanine N-acetyltransferase [Candidatus Nanopelagicales bacterium]